MSPTHILRAFKLLADLQHPEQKSVEKLWQRVKEMGKAPEVRSNSGLAYMFAEAVYVAAAKPWFRKHHGKELTTALNDLKPFVLFYMPSLSLQKQIVFVAAFHLAGLYSPELINAFLTSLNRQLLSEATPTDLFSVRLLYEFTLRDFLDAVVGSLNDTLAVRGLLSKHKEGNNGETHLLVIPKKVKNVLVQCLTNADRVSGIDTPRFLQMYKASCYHFLFDSSSLAKIGEFVVSELRRRNVFESDYCTDAVVFLYGWQPYLSGDICHDIVREAGFEIGLRISTKSAVGFGSEAPSGVESCFYISEMSKPWDKSSIPSELLARALKNIEAPMYKDPRAAWLFEDVEVENFSTTARALTWSVIPKRSKWDSILGQLVNAYAPKYARLLGLRANYCINALRTLYQDPIESLPESSESSESWQPPQSPPSASAMKDVKEEEREKLYWGADNIQIPQAEYDTIQRSKKGRAWAWSLSTYNDGNSIDESPLANAIAELQKVLLEFFLLYRAVEQLKILAITEVTHVFVTCLRSAAAINHHVGVFHKNSSSTIPAKKKAITFTLYPKLVLKELTPAQIEAIEDFFGPYCKILP